MPPAFLLLTISSGPPRLLYQLAAKANIHPPSRIQESLLQALNASSTNWPTIIQDHALALLRSGDCTTFPSLMTRVLDDIKSDTAAARSKPGQVNGAGGKSGGKAMGNGEVKEGRGEGGQSLALPKNVVEEGVRITRECLELVIDVGE
jgi:hypothetical protein